MWNFLDGYFNYIKVGLAVLAICTIFYSGFHLGNSRYLEFKASVEATAKIQEEKVKSIRSQQELVNKGITNEYEAKLTAVKSFYGRVQFNPSGSSMSGLSTTPKSADVIAAYNELAGQCAETTLQLTSLQKWLNEQIGIK